MTSIDYEPVIKDDIVYGPKLKYKFPHGGLGQYILNACDKFPDNIYQICPIENKSKTFKQFKEETLNLAANLQSKFNIGKNDVISTCMKNSLENSLPLAAAFYLAATASSLDPSLSERETAHLINLTQPKVIILDESCLPLIKSALQRVNYNVALIINGEKFSEINATNLSDLLKCDDQGFNFQPVFIEDRNTRAVIMFSSGTTGLPKGICLSHFSVYCCAELFYDLLGRTMVNMHITTLYWISALASFILQFSEGATRLGIRKFDLEETCQMIEKYKIEGAFIGTTALMRLIDMKKYALIYDITSLKNIVIGGSGTSRSHLQLAFDTYPEINITNAYGLTESGGGVSGFLGTPPGTFRRLPESAGRPLSGAAYKVVDPETRQRLKSHQKGEICIKVDYAMLGYLNTSESLFDSEGFIKSGDIGHYDEQGYLYITGRIKEMFKYQSWPVVPAFIEGIIKEHPAIEDAVVFGIPHSMDGCWPAAAVTIRQVYTKEVTPEEIADFVKMRVTEKQQLRGGVFIIKEMIRTATGKIQRSKVQEMIMKDNNIVQM